MFPVTFISASSLPHLEWLLIRDGRSNASILPPFSLPNENLRSVSLVNCNIEEVDGKAFAVNKKLVHLDLSANPLKFISYHAISRLSALEILTIDNAILSTLDAPGSNNFLPPRLSVLRLENNRIATISEDFVSGLYKYTPDLQSVWLGNNQIRVVPESLFGIPSLKKLDLRNNLVSKFPKSLKAVRSSLEVDLCMNAISSINSRDIPSRLRKSFKPWNLRGNYAVPPCHIRSRTHHSVNNELITRHWWYNVPLLWYRYLVGPVSNMNLTGNLYLPPSTATRTMPLLSLQRQWQTGWKRTKPFPAATVHFICFV